jgi:hypothetical protein
MGIGVSDGTRRPAGRLGRAAAVVVCLGVLACAACGGSGDDEEAAASSATGTDGAATEATSIATTTPSVAGSLSPPGDVPCPENRHAVVIDLRTLITEEGELYRWYDNASYDPLVRAGAVELVAAYVQRGYEIVYVTGWDATTMLGTTTPVTEALPNWMAGHGFPVGAGTSLHMWPPEEFESEDVFKTQVLADLRSEGVQVDRLYTNDPTDVPAYVSGGMGADRIHTFGPAARVEGTDPVANEDFAVHRSETIDRQAPICAV